jgi:hypothetical protein
LFWGFSKLLTPACALRAGDFVASVLLLPVTVLVAVEVADFVELSDFVALSDFVELLEELL